MLNFYKSKISFFAAIVDETRGGYFPIRATEKKTTIQPPTTLQVQTSTSTKPGQASQQPVVAAQTDRPVRKPSGNKVDYQQIPTDPVVFHLGGQPLDEEGNSADPEEKPKSDQQQDSSRPGSPVPPYQQMKINNESNTNREPTKDPEPVRRPTEQAPTNQPLYHPLKEPSRVNQADSGSPWETAKDNNEERPGQDDQQPDVKPHQEAPPVVFQLPADQDNFGPPWKSADQDQDDFGPPWKAGADVQDQFYDTFYGSEDYSLTYDIPSWANPGQYPGWEIHEERLRGEFLSEPNDL